MKYSVVYGLMLHSPFSDSHRSARHGDQKEARSPAWVLRQREGSVSSPLIQTQTFGSMDPSRQSLRSAERRLLLDFQRDAWLGIFLSGTFCSTFSGLDVCLWPTSRNRVLVYHRQAEEIVSRPTTTYVVRVVRLEYFRSAPGVSPGPSKLLRRTPSRPP